MPKDSVSHSHMLTQQQKAIAEVTKQTGVHTKLNVLALKMSEFIYLTIHSQLREPQKPQKLYNNQSTKLPLSLSLSLSSRLSSLVFLAGPKAKTVFFLSHFALPRRKTRSLSLCVSHFVHIVCYHNWEKKLRRDLRLLWGTRLIPFFFFSKAFLTGNGFWVFFVYTFCLLGSDSFVLVYCCCSWKSILTKSLTKDTNFIWFVLYHWICYCFFF